jgi:hypothetical protein
LHHSADIYLLDYQTALVELQHYQKPFQQHQTEYGAAAYIFGSLLQVMPPVS